MTGARLAVASNTQPTKIAGRACLTDSPPYFIKGAKVELLLIGVLAVLLIGVALAVVYFSLATFFRVNAKALNEVEKAENAKKKAAAATATEKKRKAHAG